MDSVHHIWCPLSSQEYQDLPDGAETTLTSLPPLSLPFNQIGVITDAVKTFPHPDSHSDRPFVSCP
ncbi:hypothetical protein ACYCPB_28115, partial [Klebsiella pneumoniae]|uniref:hypothetical protein n=2 Tax=Klebsiella michiganensis TaxID=1134687 RepID=UPI001C49933E